MPITRSRRDRACSTRAILLAGLSLWSAVGRADCPTTLQYSADIPVALDGVYGDDHDYFRDVGGVPIRVSIPAIPQRADLDGLQIDPGGDVLFSLDVGAQLDANYFDRADVIRWSGGAITTAFDASAAALPAGVDLDAVGRLGAHLALSFDRGFQLGNTYIRPADVVEFDGIALLGKLLDATALGLDPRLNVDAVHVVDSDTLLLSFDSSGTIAGIVFADQDVLQLVRSSTSWSKPCALLDRSDRWAAANLDALSATPLGDALFQDGFEQEL
jgi:hypothetical protein